MSWTDTKKESVPLLKPEIAKEVLYYPSIRPMQAQFDRYAQAFQYVQMRPKDAYL